MANSTKTSNCRAFVVAASPVLSEAEVEDPALDGAAWGCLRHRHSERSDAQHRAVEESILKIVIASIAKRCAAISLHHSLFLVRYSIFTTTFFFLLVLFLIASPAYAKYGGGSGTPHYPYLIYDANQMNAIGADSNDFDKHFKLMADIDLSGYTGTEFNIIGTLRPRLPFTGVFDGNGHTISSFAYTSRGTYIGLFGYVDDPNAEIKNLGLFAPDVDSRTGNYHLGSLVGQLNGGTITNCYVEVGRIAGFRMSWPPPNCVGGLVGHNSGKITNCRSEAVVSGNEVVGGLVGINGNNGTIINCYLTGSVYGTGWEVGGLVGSNHGTITNCYSESDVSGNSCVGGLVGYNHSGTIANCYAAGSVVGNWGYVGGLVGWNRYGAITNSYSTGSVAGNERVGGLVGDNHNGTVTTSFWDVETSGQATSDGGTGLPTADMQMQVTFTNAGWDFVGETVNGIKDIWFIPQQDYPHLWWEGMQVPMKLTPRTLNCRSQGNWVKAHLTLPQGFTVEDVDPNRPAVLHSFGFESLPLYVSVNENERVQIDAAFERETVCSLAGDWSAALTVAGFLTDGNIFLGTSKVRMVTPGANDIEELALYWLNADCVQPDFCDGFDMNRDSLVNFPDYSLFLNSQVEFVSH